MNVGSFFTIIVWIVAIAALAWLAWWVLSQFNPPPPIARIAYVAIVVVAVIAIIMLLLQATGVGFSTRIGDTTWFVPSVMESPQPLLALSVADRA